MSAVIAWAVLVVIGAVALFGFVAMVLDAIDGEPGAQAVLTVFGIVAMLAAGAWALSVVTA